MVNVFLIILSLGIIINIISIYFGKFINSENQTIASIMYEISAGMMTAIVCFELLPESMEISDVLSVINFCLIGTFITLILDIYLNSNNNLKLNSSSLIVIIAMSFHNIIEGITIGTSFIYSASLGITILIANVIHDIPESLIMGMALNKKESNVKRKIIKAIVLALPTALGFIIGDIIGKISENYIGRSLAVSAGCMLYIVACDLIPNAKELTKDKRIYTTYILGLLIGLFIIRAI